MPNQHRDFVFSIILFGFYPPPIIFVKYCGIALFKA